jgi:hypothetical protein
MSSVVYSWLDPTRAEAGPDLDALFRPHVEKNIRVWGDAVISLMAERRRIACAPPVTIRSTALFGWLTPSASRPPATAGEKVPVRLVVDPDQCAIARIDEIHPLFSTATWQQLGEWLAEQGHRPERVYEEIMPIADPMGSMSPAAGRQVVGSTSPALLRDLLAFFEDIVVRYLGTWHPLGKHSPGEGPWEVVIPRAGLFELIPGLDQDTRR